MTYQRELQLKPLITRKSVFLFGPRGVGKSFLVRQQLGEERIHLDLLRSALFTQLSAEPGRLESMVEGFAGSRNIQRFPIVIDEVQKVPELLDEVHRLIEERRWRFLLTGSSARKLRRKGANMLAGRALRADLAPLVSREIPQFDLDRALRYGTLPAIWDSPEPLEDLDAYVGTYLKEEIQIESGVRNLPAFSRFLKVAALSSGQLIHYENMASDAAEPVSTLKEHFQILQDTLLGFLVEPFTESKKRKAIATAKFYLFDTGVRNFLLGVDKLDRESDLYGSAFESWIAHELRAYLSCRRVKKPLTFWRSTSQFEVDFLLGTQCAIEVKATTRVSSKHLKGLAALAEERMIKSYCLVSQDPVARKVELSAGAHAWVLPWDQFLLRLWDGEWG